MRKMFSSKSAVIYIIFATNTVYCVLHGFTWPYWVTAGLTVCVLVLDVMKEVKSRHGR